MALHTLPAAPSGGDALLFPKPRRRPVNLTKVRRERLESLVEHLIWLLDVWDGDDPAWATGPGWGAAGDEDDAEPCDDDEASAQAPVTPGSTRPTAVLWWGVRA